MKAHHVSGRGWHPPAPDVTDRRQPRGLQDLRRASGPPLTTRELAQMIGMSSTFIRGEIRSGHLRAIALGRGRKHVFRIPFSEARRYARELGLL
jgi:excisionase family DNA binding protein